jgi:hypothetical protein
MYNWIIRGAAWVLLGLVIFCWIRWGDVDRDPFDRGGSS